MIKAVGVSFKENGKVYHFSPNGHTCNLGDKVIVETERGTQLGIVKKEEYELKDELLKSSLSRIQRIASQDDINRHEKNLNDANEAVKKCRSLADKYSLNMYIIDASFTFDRNQLFIRFMADVRVDFRSLAKELANIYKTRIELRQVGVRDKAKEIGGYGPCGKTLCCAMFMTDFDSVSINMAKNQNIALNPTKINGVCGRLMCCLKYEDDCYKECRKGLPKEGKKVITPEGEGKVISVDVLRGSYRVNIPNVGIVEFDKENESK
jgi:cell fate regulator YaaT (PSP1 superfamily)